jgi:hypothetical protein
MSEKQLAEDISLHGNLSLGLSEALSEILGREITHITVLIALSMEGIKLEADMNNVSSTAVEYSIHLRHQEKMKSYD